MKRLFSLTLKMLFIALSIGFSQLANALDVSALKVVKVTNQNIHVLKNLSQPYKAEFSPLTDAKPQPDGNYQVYIRNDQEHDSYLIYHQETPVGFAIIGTMDGRRDIDEFYITPSYRKKGIGKHFAKVLFNKYPGKWQVRQLVKAKRTIAFWRKTIDEYTKGNFEQSIVEDKDWGKVVRQVFVSHPGEVKAMQTKPKYVYKIMTEEEWSQFQTAHKTAGSAKDIEDGFIHLSKASQVKRVANRFYSDTTNIRLLQIDLDAIRGDVKWEEASNHDLYPHLFAELKQDVVVDVLTMNVSSFDFETLE